MRPCIACPRHRGLARDELLPVQAGARSLEVHQERQAAEEPERRRARLMEMADLVISVPFQTAVLRADRNYFRCPGQLALQAVLAGMDHVQVQAEMPEVWALVGAGQRLGAFTGGVGARREIEAAIRRLMVQRRLDYL
jgi:hypothetical protein